MNTSSRQYQPATAVLVRIIAAASVLYRRKEHPIPGLEVSDSTWTDWEEAILRERRLEKTSGQN